MKIVINSCFGGFCLSDDAYEWLIAHGVKSGPYKTEHFDMKTGLYERRPENTEIIFDRRHPNDESRPYPDRQRYWENWIELNRSWPLLIQCVEELGSKANGPEAKLEVVKTSEGFTISEYDGCETVRGD